MKFVSWNVNGLRACITKGFLDRFNEFDADFFCLQETKLSEEQLKLDMPGYHQYWCYAEKKGYSGTAIFTKHTPLSVSYGIGVPELDNEGRVITLEYEEFYLVTCYTPNAQRGLARIDHRMTWDDAFRAYLKKLDESKPVILCGDLNVAHQEIDLKNPASNRSNAGFSDEERQSFQKTLDMGFTDTFRHLYPDATGRYSWWSYMFHARENNAGWRIDYFLVSDRLQNAIHQADIHSDILGSDHCPVSLDLDITVNGGIWSPTSRGPATVTEPAEKKPKKEKEASADSAKAPSVIALICILLLGISALLFGYLFDFSAPAAPSYQPFTVQVYSLSFEHHVFVKTGSDISVQYIDVYDGTEDYYLDGLGYTDLDATAIRENANAWLRLDLTAEGLQHYSSDWTPVLRTKGLDTLNGQVLILPYYQDLTLSTPGGWLVYAVLPDSTLLNVHLDAAGTAFSYTQTVDPFPPVDTETAEALDTNALAALLLESKDLLSDYRSLTAKDLLIVDSAIYMLLTENHPALKILEDREDAVTAIMDHYSTNTESKLLAPWLLSLDVYRQKMTPAQEANYLAGNYISSPHALFIWASPDPDGMTTAELVNWIFSWEVLVYNFSQCSCAETAYALYEIYRPHSDALRELPNRIDAVSALMNCQPPLGSYIATYMLGLSDIREKMTVNEEYLYLTTQYSSHPAPVKPTTVYLNRTNSTTSQLVKDFAAASEAADELYNVLSQCSRTETMYLVCQYYREYNYILDALLDRYDLIQELLPYTSSYNTDDILYGPTSRNIYDYLIMVRGYMDELHSAASLTSPELVEYILKDASILGNLQMWFSYSHAYMDREDFCRSVPALYELLNREDGIDALMNTTIPNYISNVNYPYLILLNFCTDRMTPAQEALFVTNQYPNAPKAFSFSLDAPSPESLSTHELVLFLEENGSTILDYLDRCSSTEARYQVYLFLRPHSNILQELETRTDALTEMQNVFENSFSMSSPIGLLIELWDLIKDFDE